MIRVVALEQDLLDKVHDIIIDYRDDVESGATVTDQPRSSELHDVDAILSAIRTAETLPGTD